jgi:hypothetical protein
MVVGMAVGIEGMTVGIVDGIDVMAMGHFVRGIKGFLGLLLKLLFE